MQWLLTVFDDTVVVPRNDTNRSRIRSFESLAATGAKELCDEDETSTFLFFPNAPARISYEKVTGVISDDGQSTSIFCIAWMDAWIACSFEDLHRRLKGVGGGIKEPYVLKTRYNALIPVATANIPAEFLYSLRSAISADDPRSLNLDAMFESQDGRTACETMENYAMDFAVDVYFKPR